jgi:hypothetical protein
VQAELCAVRVLSELLGLLLRTRASAEGSGSDAVCLKHPPEMEVMLSAAVFQAERSISLWQVCRGSREIPPSAELRRRSG